MQYASYEEYVKDAKEYYSKKDIKISSDLLILPEKLFNNFGGVIEFGPGSKDLVNKKCKCLKELEDKK